MKLAVIFPGIGYTSDKPLLHYSRKILKKNGYEVICIDYDVAKEKIENSEQRKNEVFEQAFIKATAKLNEAGFDKYEEIIFVGKSIGTVVAGAIADKFMISPRYVLFTPIRKAFDYKHEDAIAFHGTNDPWCNIEEVRRLCDEQGIELNITDNADHSLETGAAADDAKNLSKILFKTEEYILKSQNPNLKQALNPYMGGNEYVPDGEPYVFDDRVYVYGSHDKFNGNIYCMLDYVCWSAPVSDLGNWRYEGVIYKRTQDPVNVNGLGKLYAPDVAKGPDGRYYLYYALNNQNRISVAVCDFPAGQYEFYGYVHYADGTLLGDREEDEMQFDPGVLMEDEKVYLYTGFCPIGMKERHGAMLSVLDKDMLTILEKPKFVAPSEQHSKGTGFEGHEFFEAPSIRKIEGKYAFIYSSIKFHELCYALADNPRGPFEYKGVIISNGDLHIDSYKSAEQCTFLCANNHGSVEKIGDDYYIFYHRHTNGTNYSRQGCFEKLKVNPDGTIEQAMMTSNCSLAPLKASGTYPTYLACNLFIKGDDTTYLPWSGWVSDKYPVITQDGADGDICNAYIKNMMDGATAGFKSFDFDGVKKIGMYTLGYGDGDIQFRLSIDGPVVGTAKLGYENDWSYREAEVNIEDGVHDLYITYSGNGWCSLREIIFK